MQVPAASRVGELPGGGSAAQNSGGSLATGVLYRTHRRIGNSERQRLDPPAKTTRSFWHSRRRCEGEGRRLPSLNLDGLCNVVAPFEGAPDVVVPGWEVNEIGWDHTPILTVEKPGCTGRFRYHPHGPTFDSLSRLAWTLRSFPERTVTIFSQVLYPCRVNLMEWFPGWRSGMLRGVFPLNTLSK